MLARARFANKPRLRPLLRYIVEQTLAGRKPSEHEIALDVFERPEFRGGPEETIVRTQAGILRRVLDDYYRNEGQADDLRISIPKGAYVAVIASAERPIAEAGSPQGDVVDSPDIMVEAVLVIRAKIKFSELTRLRELEADGYEKIARIANTFSTKLKCSRYGSVVLYFETTQEGFDAIITAYQFDELQEVGGYPLDGVRLRDEQDFLILLANTRALETCFSAITDVSKPALDRIQLLVANPTTFDYDVTLRLVLHHSEDLTQWAKVLDREFQLPKHDGFFLYQIFFARKPFPAIIHHPPKYANYNMMGAGLVRRNLPSASWFEDEIQKVVNYRYQAPFSRGWLRAEVVVASYGQTAAVHEPKLAVDVSVIPPKAQSRKARKGQTIDGVPDYLLMPDVNVSIVFVRTRDFASGRWKRLGAGIP